MTWVRTRYAAGKYLMRRAQQYVATAQNNRTLPCDLAVGPPFDN